jgi:hypothetical protein
MKYLVLYAEECTACSDVAALIRQTGTPGLEARGLADPQVLDLLASAHLEVPNRPAMLAVGDDSVRLLSGIRMRLRLAQIVGWRRSSTVVRLAAAEWRARLARSTGRGMSTRRGVLGGAVAGVAGWALASGPAAAASTRGGQPAITTAESAEADRVMATAAVQQAVRTWGPVDKGVMKVTGGHQPVLVLTHSRDEVLTFVDNSPGALRDGRPVALSIGAAPGPTRGIRFYTVGGTPLADVAVVSGRVTATPASRAGIEEEPDVSVSQLSCFIACLGARVNINCADQCASCIHTPGVVGKIPSCIQCAACAGPHGISCAKDCGLKKQD